MKYKMLVFLLGGILLGAGCHSARKQAVYTGVLEGRTIDVPALTGGKIVRLNVSTGDEVAKGDTIAVNDTSTLILQKAQLQAGFKEINAQKDVLATHLNQAKANVSYVRQELKRIQTLVQKKSAPQQKLDAVTNKLEQAEAALRLARQNFQILSAKRDQLFAKINLVQKKIDDATILSPAQGLVTVKYFEAGEAVPPLGPVVELLKIDTLHVKIYVAEKTLPKIRTGQKATLHVDGLNRSFEGRVIWISPKAEFTPKTILTPETRTSLVYAVKIRVPNPEGILKDGMPVTIELKTTK
ncbi:MAG: HlyD family efflux transporter periplasmic adaptor subunit [Calditrichaeota bacterium]|nr:HlyD family efflux transporter periplasmic adaptor subunit [Calditrichota bacterium]